MAKASALKIAQQEPPVISFEAETGKVGRIRITVDGRGPLLTHNPASMGAVVDAMKGGRVPEPEVEAEAGVYRNADGVCCLRGEAFRASLLGAAGAWRAKKSSMRTRLAHVVVVEDLVPLQRRDGTLITDYVIDVRRAIVQRQGILRRRPRFEEWSCTFTFEFDAVLVSEPKIIADILHDAGARVGIGDYRPGRNGPFGRYGVRSYQILD